MAIGDLSPAQARFRDYLVMATGLEEFVVTAWIGAESGWGVSKPGHNYLNVGPGRRYSSEVEAAQATAALINTSGNYGPVRLAAQNGTPDAQLDAIVESPWDEGHYTADGGVRGGKLRATYEGVKKALGFDINDPVGSVLGGSGGVLDPDTWLTFGLTLLFTLAGLGLVVLGVHRLVTGGSK